MVPRHSLALALLPLLAACGGSGGGGKVATAVTKPPPRTSLPVRAPVRQPPPLARIQAAPGLEGVVGQRPDELERQFGPARLDVLEGDARKLQFGAAACVLDVYFYPPAPGREVQATYVEARRASDGQEVDRAACIAALRKR